MKGEVRTPSVSHKPRTAEAIEVLEICEHRECVVHARFD